MPYIHTQAAQVPGEPCPRAAGTFYRNGREAMKIVRELMDDEVPFIVSDDPRNPTVPLLSDEERDQAAAALREYAEEIVQRSHTDAAISKGESLYGLATKLDGR